jgi:hypothetical protein
MSVVSKIRDKVQEPIVVRFVECYVGGRDCFEASEAYSLAAGRAQELVASGYAYRPEAEDLFLAKAQIAIRARMMGVVV